METYELLDDIQRVLTILDADEFPEIHNYLFDLINNISESPYEMANKLLLLDKPEPLPQIIIDFIEQLFNMAFEFGNADAMNDIGAQYYSGYRGFEQNFSKAIECYKLAAESGSRQAQENLGYCYYYGRNVPIDYEKAYHYFVLGALDGHIISLYKIGDMYANGYYVSKNDVEAFNIYEHCIDIMSDESAHIVAGPVFLRLGKCFLNGTGTKTNYKSALICFQKAELFLYDMVNNGDIMYKKSLISAIEGQKEAREKLTADLPNDEWIHD